MITSYIAENPKIKDDIVLALVPDFHDNKKAFCRVREAFDKLKPDAILIPGDVCNDHLKESLLGEAFLRYCAGIAPTFYALGNHEYQFNKADFDDVRKTGVHFLNDTFEAFTLCGQPFTVGGLRSSSCTGRKEHFGKEKRPPETEWLDAFVKSDGFKLLLCHHPEYYPKYLKDRAIDLVVSGHAHGGQIRLGRINLKTRVGSFPLYAPGQGVFPKYTDGFIDGRFVISRGLCNHSFPVPRLFNPPEVVFISLKRAVR